MIRPEVSRREAARELLRRRRARESTLAFTEYTTPQWSPGRVHRAIAEQLDRVLRREIDRLMLLVPPQHGKSTIASMRFPALALGRDPTQDVICASATGLLAEKFGREVRNCIGSQGYGFLFPGTSLAEDSQAKGMWSTDAGGSYYAVGVGGALLGRGGNLGIIDDPFATWQDSQSETMRDHAWDWYRGTFYNRMRPGSPIIVINHRMHEADLCGRLIDEMRAGKDRWEIVEIPADFENPPWVERYDAAALRRLEANSDARVWSAMYMQQPTPESGTFFKREWFAERWYDPRKPRAGHRYMTSDFAVTDGGGDSTDIATHVVDPAGDLYLAFDAWTGKTTADVWIDELCRQVLTHKPMCHFGEGGPIRRAVEPFLTRRARELSAYCRHEWLPSISDKPTRARALQGRAASGKVWLPDNEYGRRLYSQLMKFPASDDDDAVDTAGMMGRALDEAHPGMVPKTEPPKRRDRYDHDDDNEATSWKAA